jgi:hypothetical protein
METSSASTSPTSDHPLAQPYEGIKVPLNSFWKFCYNGVFSRKDRKRDPQEVLFDLIPSQIILPNKTSVIGRRIKTVEQLFEADTTAGNTGKNAVANAQVEDGTIPTVNTPLVIFDPLTPQEGKYKDCFTSEFEKKSRN